MSELTFPVYLSISLFAEVFPLWGDSCTLQLHFDVSSREDSSSSARPSHPELGPSRVGVTVVSGLVGLGEGSSLWEEECFYKRKRRAEQK